jgi:hypothetical protein
LEILSKQTFPDDVSDLALLLVGVTLEQDALTAAATPKLVGRTASDSSIVCSFVSAPDSGTPLRTRVRCRISDQPQQRVVAVAVAAPR